jgi:hypothetical protein
MNEKIEAVLTAAIIVVGYFGVEAGIRQIWAPGAQRKQEFVVKELNKIRDPEGVKKNRLWSEFGNRGGPSEASVYQRHRL